MTDKGLTAAWNLRYVNFNPRGTICPICLIFIGHVFHPDEAPFLPMHPGCYCAYVPTRDPVTNPNRDWKRWFDDLKRNAYKTWRKFVQKAAWLLRMGWPLGILIVLKAEAKRYNEEEYEPRKTQEAPMSHLTQDETPAPALPDAQGDDLQENRGNHPLNPQNGPQKASQRVALGRVLLSPTGEQRLYDAVLVTAGWIQQDNGQNSDWLIPADVLRASLDRGLFSSLPHYVDHPEMFGFGWAQRPSVRDLAGIASDARWDPTTEGIRAQIRLYDTEAGQLLATLYDQIIADREAGKDVPPLGLSIVCFRKYKHDEESGARVWTEIQKVSSVDAVYEPGAAGYIRAALSSAKALGPAVPPSQPLVHPSGGTMSEENRNPTPAPEEPTAQVQVASPPAADPPADPNQAHLQDWRQQQQQTLQTLQSAVERLNGLLAQQEEPNTIQGMGEPPRGPVLYGGLSGLDQVEMAVEAMLTGTRPPSGVRPLTGIRELYMLLSGDYELNGVFHEDRVYLANVTTSTMAGIVANRLNKIVVNMFQEYDQWWAPAVTIRDFASLQDVRWITLGGVGELPTVAEGAAYTEMSWDDQTETDSFVKKGGYLGITLETIDKDDTARVMAAPRALAQAAWLTLGKAIAAIFTANSGYGPTMSDSNYLIDSSNHSNEGSTALSFSSWETTKIAMMKYTELNSGERLGALTRPRLLWVPIDLENTAIEILAAGEGHVDDADYHVNAEASATDMMARLRNAKSRVITVPFWTDTNDWVAQADPNMYPSIGLGFRYGRTPEIFSVADPRAGLMFTNDTMPIKVRFFYAVGPTDWRGVYKHLVT
jgi:hypothetical protein